MRVRFLVALAAFLIAIPLAGHHAESVFFDDGRTVKATGTVIRVAWVNPHTIVLIQVENPNDKTKQEVALEFPPPNTLLRIGASRATFNPGEIVSVVASPGISGQDFSYVRDALGGGSIPPASNILLVREIKLPNGNTMTIRNTLR
jgi:hypothetical protein